MDGGCLKGFESACCHNEGVSRLLLAMYRYMDPGNWATNIAGGSTFGYKLLIVILLSSVTAMFLQYLSLKLGIVSNRDLAQACRDAYHQKARRFPNLACDLLHPAKAGELSFDHTNYKSCHSKSFAICSISTRLAGWSVWSSYICSLPFSHAL